MGAYADADVPIIVRGEGPYVYDEHGNRYLDGLSGAVLLQRRPRPHRARRGRRAPGRGARLLRRSGATRTRARSSWPRGSPSLTPGDLNRVFFTSGGSEAVESAIKLARAYHQRTGNPRKTKFITREVAYHGTTLGRARRRPASPALRTDFEPLVPGGNHVPNTNCYHWPEDRDPLWAADQIEEKILFEGPETVAAVILEPLQNAGGCIPPQEGYFQRVREICDRHDVLLISDEVICAWGRLGHYFGCERYGYQPDIITTAKALTSAYAPMGAMIASDRVAEPFMHGTEIVHPRLHLRRPPGGRGGGDGQPRRVRARGPLRPRAAPARASSGRCSTACATSRSSATCAATGTSTRSSWSRTRTPRRASPTRSPSRCCAASSPASSTAAA